MAINKTIPQSRIMLNYDTSVEGKKKRKQIPYKLLIVGDVSKGLSKYAKKDFINREIISAKSTMDHLLADMEIEVEAKVENCINPSKNSTLDVKIPLKKMKDFKPDSIVENIPQLKTLAILRDMLKSFMKDVDNNRSLKDMLDQILSDETSLESLQKEFSVAKDKYSISLMRDTTSSDTDNEGDVK